MKKYFLAMIASVASISVVLIIIAMVALGIVGNHSAKITTKSGETLTNLDIKKEQLIYYNPEVDGTEYEPHKKVAEGRYIARTGSNQIIWNSEPKDSRKLYAKNVYNYIMMKPLCDVCRGNDEIKVSLYDMLKTICFEAYFFDNLNFNYSFEYGSIKASVSNEKLFRGYYRAKDKTVKSITLYLNFNSTTTPDYNAQYEYEVPIFIDGQPGNGSDLYKLYLSCK